MTLIPIGPISWDRVWVREMRLALVMPYTPCSGAARSPAALAMLTMEAPDSACSTKRRLAVRGPFRFTSIVFG